MPSRKLDVLAFARGGDVIDVVTRQVGVFQNTVKPFLCQRHRVAAANALTALGQPSLTAVRVTSE